MPRWVEPDEGAARFRAVWLGPDGYTLPIRARYVSWALWFVLQIVFTLLIHLVFPVGASLAWAGSLSVLITRFLMIFVDSDLPLSALPAVAAAEVAAIGRPEPEQTWQVSTAAVRIRSITATSPETP